MAANHVQPVAASAPLPKGRNLDSAQAGEDAAALTLDERGMVRDCNHAGEVLFKYRRSELVWQHVSLLLPQLTGLDLIQHGEPNPRLRYLCRIGRRFGAVTRDGERFDSELFLNLLDGTGRGHLSLIVRPVDGAAVSPAAVVSGSN